MVGRNNYSADRLAQVFGITVSNHMAEVQARVLPPPVVSVIQHSQFYGCLLIYHFNSKDDE
jgi:hypothetical protein